MQTSDSIVIIPTYNERENIENIIRAVFGLPKVFHILVIEDGSPDGTATIVKTLQQEFPERLFMIERKGKLGLGTAYITGFKWALEHTYEYIFEMDADFSHNPNDLPRLYQACAEQGGDVSIGSRYVSGVNVVLADGAGTHVLFRFQIRAVYHRNSRARYHRRIRLLPSPGIGNDRFRPHPLQRIRLSD